MPDQLSQEDRRILLRIARQSIEEAVNGSEVSTGLDLKSFPPMLQQKGATFVTLTKKGQLRGCIGSLEPYLPLAEDVREHAVAAALEDFRFSPVTALELPDLEIEISRLTLPQPLEYQDSDDLLRKLRPGVDGVILKDGMHRATFLPQVWEKIPDPAEFLSQLCWKMGALPDRWMAKKLQVFIYQVEEFHEQPA